MITVKAFKKEGSTLYCQPANKKFYYEIGKTYRIPTNKVSIYSCGFHASANCDISETLNTYNVSKDTYYALVDLNVVMIDDGVAVGDSIKVIRELTFDECIEYDKTGLWCYKYARNVEGADIKKLQDAVIEKDKDGELCFRFALDVKCADIKKLQKAVIEKDKTGEWCYEFAHYIEGADIKELQEAVINKDMNGMLSYEFALNIKGADIERLQNAVIEKDKDGKLCLWFAYHIKGSDIELLKKAIYEKDSDGLYKRLFYNEIEKFIK